MKKFLISTLLLAGLPLAGCVEDRPSDGEPDRERVPDGRTIVFTISNSAPASPTRATRAVDDPEENERAINRLDLFFFAPDGRQLFYPAAGQIVHHPDAGEVRVTIPEAAFALLDGVECTIYIAANTPLERAAMEGLPLAELEALVIENGEGRMFNLQSGGPDARPVPPVDFLMTGSTAATISRDKQHLGSIILRRAAAKIVVDISSAVVEGYTPGRARVRLSGYLDKTRLGSETAATTDPEDFKTSPWRLLARNPDGEGPPYTLPSAEAFHTYLNDWSANPDLETFITIELEWIATGSVPAEPKTYFYRIPFSYIGAEGGSGSEHRDRIRRNHIYQFMVNVSELGGLDPESAIDLAANFDAIDWSEGRVEVSILSYHYLFVYNSHMQIHERPSYEWEYRSSLPVEIEVADAMCSEFHPDGSSTEVHYSAGEQQYPDVTRRAADGRTFFTAHSMIPTNYVPLEITLRVSNAAELFAAVHLTIFPKKHVTSSYSNGGTNQRIYPRAGAYRTPTGTQGNGDWGTNNPGEAEGDNFNFYRVTTTSLDASDQARGIMLGDPTEDVPHPAGAAFGNMRYNQTRTDDDSQGVISPEFVIASRRGITSQLDWDEARQRCARYREAQYAAGTWRVPTFAELAMLGEMQNDPDSAIKELFVNASGNGWWTARREYRIRVDLYTHAGGGGVFQNGTGSVRCVHDTWRD